MDLNQILTGQTEEHVAPWGDSTYLVHHEMRPALEEMVAAAAQESQIDLRVCSAFRSFERQMSIWNAKATGNLKLRDDQGVPLDFHSLTSQEILERILRWSALPGLSRHHWGTDIDVYDAAAVPPAYNVQLTTEESYTHFSRLHDWLDVNMGRFGFFRPYSRDLGGIAPEAWHLSYAPLAQKYFESYSIRLLEDTIREAPLAMKAQVLENLPQIFERYFLRITAPTIT